jgi:predicted molibdopterin-dependent oxidoreductase YjgC
MKHLERFVLEYAVNSTDVASADHARLAAETAKQENEAIQWAMQALDFYFHA